MSRIGLIAGFIAAIFILGCGQELEKEQVMTGQVSPGVNMAEILIGSSSALSGHAGYLGTNYMRGALAYINYVNEQGGIHGRKIKIISYDDQYDPPRCVANTHKLISEDKVFALFNYVGTPTGVKIIDMVEGAKIPLVGLFTGAHALRNPLENIYSISEPLIIRKQERLLSI